MARIGARPEDVGHVSDELQAARLRLELEHDAQDPSTGPRTRETLQHAIGELDRRYPRAGHRALIASEEELGGLHGSLRTHRQQLRRAGGIDAAHARRERERISREGHGTRRDPRPPKTRRSSGKLTRSSRAAAPRARRLLGAGAGAISGSGGGGLALAFAGGTILVAVAYLLLQNAELAPRGRSLAELGASGFTFLLNAIVRPVDPLAPGKGASGRVAVSPPTYDQRIAAGEVAGPPTPSNLLTQPGASGAIGAPQTLIHHSPLGGTTP